MNEIIKTKLAILVTNPGCYLMKDETGTIIYIGKAKNLKNRVSQYFNRPHEFKTQKLVSEIVDFDTIITYTEKEALLLEINLIKKYFPKYNIKLKDNTFYPYIQVTKERHPRLKIVRNALNKNAYHYGPFPSSNAAYSTLDLLNRLYPLRKCKTIGKTSCLYYHMKQCVAPCIATVEETTYSSIISDIKKFLHGDIKSIKADLQKNMKEFSDNLQFENAQECKELLIAIDHVASRQNIQLNDKVDRDVFGIYEKEGYVSIAILMYRGGYLAYKATEVIQIFNDLEELFTSYVVSFYEKNLKPKEVIIGVDVDSELLSSVLETNVISTKSGSKSEMVAIAITNAQKAFEERWQIVAETSEQDTLIANELATIADTTNANRIELFDNSHIQGDAAVSAVVVFINGQPQKKLYRKYKIQGSNKRDDLASMYEVVYRRHYRLISEKQPFSDLVIVDGGQGQIQSALKAIQDLELNIPVLGLVKDNKHRTRALMNAEFKEIDLNKDSPLFKFLMRMQNEVHRYVITFHRNLKGKTMTSSILDAVPGLGAKRKQALLSAYDTVQNIKNASVLELTQYIPKEVAVALLEHLHNTKL